MVNFGQAQTSAINEISAFNAQRNIAAGSALEVSAAVAGIVHSIMVAGDVMLKTTIDTTDHDRLTRTDDSSGRIFDVQLGYLHGRKAIVASQINTVRNTFSTLEQELQKDHTTAEVTQLETTFTAISAGSPDAIASDQTLILMRAYITNLIAYKRATDVPRPATLIQLNGAAYNRAAPITARQASELTITGRKNVTAGSPNNQTVEIYSGGSKVKSIPASGTARFEALFDDTEFGQLPKGRQTLQIRTINPETHVYEISDIIVNIQNAVPALTGVNHDPIPAEVAQNGSVKINGSVMQAGDSIEIVDGATGASLTPQVIRNNIHGQFNIEIPGTVFAAVGQRSLRLRTTRAGVTAPHEEPFSVNVSNTVSAPLTFAAPTFHAENLAHNPPIYNPGNIPHGIHDPLIEITNATPGSQIEISGGGMQAQVINVPLGAHDAHIHLHGLDTSHHGTKNLTIKYTDPQNPSNPPKIFPFDVNVTENLHHEPDNLRISETNFLAAIPTGNYVLQNNAAGRGPYRVGRLKRALGIGWWAEVPVLPGEERIFGLRKTLKSTSRRGLYTKVRQYIEQRNAQAKAMNHSDHAHETPHDPAHTETPATTPGTTPSSAEAHTDAAHPAGAHPASEGTFYDRSVEKVFGHGWIGKGLVGLKNLVPKPLRSLGGNTVGAGVTTGVVGGVVYGGSLALGSAALASAIVPIMGVTFTASMLNRFLKWRKWWPHNKEEGGGGSGGAHGTPHA